MKRIITILSFTLLFTLSYSQKTQRWKENGNTCEIIEDTSTLSFNEDICIKKNISVAFLGDFYKDEVKLILKRQILVDTIISTRNEEGIEVDNNIIFIPKIKFKKCNSKKIYIILNNKKYRFPLKNGYSIIYISLYEEMGKEGVNELVYSMTYTNKLLKRL